MAQHAVSKGLIKVSGFLLLLISLGGCMPGTIATTVGTGVVIEEKKRYEHMHKVEAAVADYVRDHAESPCQNGEDRVMDSAVEIIEKHRLTGFNEVMDRLNDIYQSTEQPEQVRAAALYNMAVLHSRKGGMNKVYARESFKQLYVEFPDHYRCIFAETEWRDTMIQKQLLYPGESLEQFIKDAERDIQRRQSAETS